MAASNFPNEICMEILERLPVKSLLRFKVVCKSWKSIISSPYFIDRHFDRFTTNRSKLAIFIEEYSNLERKCSIFFHTLNFSDASSLETTIVEHPITRCEEAHLLSWCRGLLLLRVKCYPNLLLWNPSTREYKKVPNPPDSPHYHYTSIFASALGYDFTLKTHKIVLICETPARIHSNKFLVYNVKTNSWTPIYTNEDREYHAYYDNFRPKTLVNGAPHWLVCYCYGIRGDDTLHYEIEYFDFATDKFVVIPQPDDHDYDVSYASELLDMEGRLCISHYSHGNVKIWVMEEYGVKESWSMIYNVNDIVPLCFAKTIDVALVRGFDEQVNESWFAIYNGMEKGIQLKFLAGKDINNQPFTFVESLISLETEKVEEVEVV